MKYIKYLYLALGSLFIIQLYNFLSIKNGIVGLSPICDFSLRFSCSIVESSSYSTLLGLPLSAWGLMWLSVSFFLYKQGKTQGYKLWSLWNLAGLVFSFSYLAIMVSILKTYCLLCLSVDLLVLILNYLSLNYLKDKVNLKSSALAFGVGMVTSMAVIISVDYFVELRVKDLGETTKFKQAPITNLSEQGDLILGNPKGKLVVVQYTDFQCPACKQASEIVKEVILKNPEVKVIIKNYPLSNLCNPIISSVGHIWACNAASLAFCSQKQNRFEDFYSLAYKNQEKIKISTDFIEILKEKGFDLEKLSECVMDPKTESLIKTDIQEANLLNIEGTPTFYFQGKKVEMWSSPFFWKEILKQ